eukprot:3940728-Rhodomonas_salina.2
MVLRTLQYSAVVWCYAVFGTGYCRHTRSQCCTSDSKRVAPWRSRSVRYLSNVHTAARAKLYKYRASPRAVSVPDIA